MKNHFSKGIHQGEKAKASTQAIVKIKSALSARAERNWVAISSLKP
jgi:hypothetical protein